MIYSKELLQYRGIVFVSGDSLPHEGINALFSRSDWKEVTQVPVGVLPVGSGNGLANSLAK
jgi:sphingosine kinase